VPDKRIIVFIGIFVLVNLLQAIFTPISEDEAYYWLWSQNLDWGYFDHPPMIAWWIFTGYEIFQNELGVRIFTIFMNGFGLLILWKILQPKTQRQFKLFILIFGSVLVFQVFGFLATPDAPLLFFTILYLFSLKKFLEKDSTFYTILLGIAFAGLMYSKYHGVLVILFTLIPIFKTWWRNPKFYLAVLLGLILYLPHVFWLVQHDFAPVKYHFLERSSDEHFEFRKLFNYLGIYFFGCAPLLSYFIFNSIFASTSLNKQNNFSSYSIFQKSVWWLAVLPGFFFFLSIFKDNVQPQWLLISFVAMTLVTYFYYSEKDNLKWIFRLGFAGIILVFILRILIMTPGISPLFKNLYFGSILKKYSVKNAVFEKYQEASVYKFYNPKQNVAVHRTLGNRHSQFSLWQWEEVFYDKNVTYISPWVKSDDFFTGYKNRNYYLKAIPNYVTYELVKIESIEKIEAKPNEKINLTIKIRNGHKHPVTIGGGSDLKLNINYYQDLQYEIIYSDGIITDEFTLQPTEEKELKIEFKNIPQKGNFKACLGLNYVEVGTSYLSKPILVSSI